jgi:hypothetical protein
LVCWPGLVGGTGTLETCALDKQELQRIMGAMQHVLSELELASLSNLEWFAADLDSRAEAVLLRRLEQLVALWMRSFSGQDESWPPAQGAPDAFAPCHAATKQSVEATDYIRREAEAARSRLEIKVKNGVLVVEPPVAGGLKRWVQALSAQVCAHLRLLAVPLLVWGVGHIPGSCAWTVGSQVATVN